jgi:hypothetical protein
MEKRKRVKKNNGQQSTTQKSKEWAICIQLKAGGILNGKQFSFSITGTCRVNLVKMPVITHMNGPYSYLGSSWSLSCGSLIYNYIYNQCLSPLTQWVRIPLRQCVLDTTLWDKMC